MLNLQTSVAYWIKNKNTILNQNDIHEYQFESERVYFLITDDIDFQVCSFQNIGCKSRQVYSLYLQFSLFISSYVMVYQNNT